MRHARKRLALCSAGLALAGSASAAPVLLDDRYTPDAAVFTVPAPGVLANDSAGLTVQSIDITGLKGTVTAFADGRFSFTPQVGLATDTSFRYSARDATGATAAATVSFDMTSTMPVAVGDAYVLTTPTLVIPAAGVLANDSGGIGNVQVQSIDITGLKGTVTAFADGRFSFTPQSGLASVTSFGYTIRDAVGRTSTATVTIDASTQLPVAVNDRYVLTAPTLVVPAAGVLANDGGGIGNVQVQSIDITGLKGTVVAFADGRFSFTPQAGLATDTRFAYTVRDEVGRTSQGIVDIDMTSSLPSAVDDVYDLLADTAFDVEPAGMLANDLGGIGGLRALSIDITGLQGSVTALVDGSFRFTPRPGFVGSTSFIYTMGDEIGRFDRGLVTLNVGVTGGGGGGGGGGGTPLPEPSSAGLVAAALAAWRLRRTRRANRAA